MSRSFDSMSLTTRPSMAIVPPEISSKPASIRSSVDLPQPDGPTSTMNSPSLMSKLKPCRTLVVPKAFSMFWNVTDAINYYPQKPHRKGAKKNLFHHRDTEITEITEKRP